MVFRNGSLGGGGGLEGRTFLPDKSRAWVRVCRTPSRMKSAILV